MENQISSCCSFEFPIGLISNFNSKQNKKEYLNIHVLTSILGGRNKCIVKETKNLEDLYNALKEFKELGISIILSNGGDGTHQKLINYLLLYFPDYTPCIVPLKGGTMNMLPRNLKLNCSPYSTARWVKLVVSKKTTPLIERMPILKININNDIVYGFVFVAGCAYKILNIYYQYPNGGPATAVKSIFKSIADVLIHNKNKFYFEYTNSNFIFNKEKEINLPYLITIASSIKTLILGFNPFGSFNGNENEFFIMVDGEPMIKDYNITKYYRFSENETWDSKRIVAKISDLTLDAESGYTIDGEMFELKEKSKVSISTGPKINFLVPNNYLFF